MKTNGPWDLKLVLKKIYRTFSNPWNILLVNKYVPIAQLLVAGPPSYLQFLEKNDVKRSHTNSNSIFFPRSVRSAQSKMTQFQGIYLNAWNCWSYRLRMNKYPNKIDPDKLFQSKMYSILNLKTDSIY